MALQAKSTRALFLTALVAAAVVACGCQTKRIVTRKARLRVKGKIIIVPFREGQNFYYDSEAGSEIAIAAAAYLSRNTRNPAPADHAVLRGPVRALLFEKSLPPAAWAQIGRDAGADYVLHGAIEALSWNDSFDPSLPRCNFTISYSVVEVKRGREILRKAVNGHYPVALLSDGGLTVFEMGREGLRTRSYGHIGAVIARTFYDHTISRNELEDIRESGNAASRR